MIKLLGFTAGGFDFGYMEAFKIRLQKLINRALQTIDIFSETHILDICI